MLTLFSAVKTVDPTFWWIVAPQHSVKMFRYVYLTRVFVYNTKLVQWPCLDGWVVIVWIGLCDSVRQYSGDDEPSNSVDLHALPLKHDVISCLAVGARWITSTPLLQVSLCIFTALHEMQTRSSDENSVCPSVCPSHAWSLTKWKKDRSRFLYHTKEHLS